MSVDAYARRATTTVWIGAGLAVAVLLVANVLNNTVLRPQAVAAAVIEVTLLAALAWWSRLGTAGVGVAGETWARGLRWAGAAAGVVLVLYLIALVLPLTRTAFLDRRGDLSLGQAAFTATVPVLLATVLLEEFAFRGVLWGLLRHLRGPAFATIVSSVLFGLWHVIPALDLLDENRAAREVLGTSTVGAVVFGVLSTTVAGLVFGELRRRSGSLLAPIGLHWASNGLGYVFAAIVWATAGPSG